MRIGPASANPRAQMAAVVMYRTPWCPLCVRAEALLRGKGIPFVQVDVSRDWDKRRWLEQRSGRSTLPLVFVDDDPIGGVDELLALEHEGKLASLLLAS